MAFSFELKGVKKDLKSFEEVEAKQAIKETTVKYGQPEQVVYNKATWVVNTVLPDTCVAFSLLFVPGGKVYNGVASNVECRPTRAAYEKKSVYE